MEKEMIVTLDLEFQSLIPPLHADELAQLEENILAHGCRDPLTTWNGLLLDGHNRLAICRKHGIPFGTKSIELADRSQAVEWIIKNQFGRRNLPPYVRTKLALCLEEVIAERAKANQVRKPADSVPQNSAEQVAPIETRNEIAKLAGVSHDTVDKVKTIQKSGAPELIASVSRGDVSISAAADVATLPKAEQGEIVARGEKEILAASKKIRTERAETRRADRIKKIAVISNGNAPLPGDRFPVIYCDPPWRYDHAQSDTRVIENQYPTMDLKEIIGLPVADIAQDDCVLFLWATSPKLRDAFSILDAWGFQYKTCAVWDKQKIGMGYYFRQQHEILLVATKGSLPTPEPSDRPPSVFSIQRGAHSAKPVEFHEAIEAMYPGLRKIELFARTPRHGWEAWGNQAQKVA